jgi:LysR family transcriptional regulator, transcriptional activator of the cysJI operon
MEFDNIETVKRAVEIDNGVAIVPLASVEEETENGSLCAIEIESADMWRPIGLVQRRGEPSAAVRAFVSLLRKRDVL